jgi:YggT family protein
VILSWVAPGNNHPLLQIVEEMSDAILQPIRKFVPPMGGLDFTPIIGLVLLNLINTSFIQIISSMV